MQVDNIKLEKYGPVNTQRETQRKANTKQKRAEHRKACKLTTANLRIWSHRILETWLTKPITLPSVLDPIRDRLGKLMRYEMKNLKRRWAVRGEGEGVKGKGLRTRGRAWAAPAIL